MVFLPSGDLELVSELGVAYRRDERSLIVSRFLADLGTRTFPACFGMDMNYLDLENYHGGQLVAQLFAQRGIMKELTPDAVFCANDHMAAGAIKAPREHRLKVPNDVAVVGYDNTDLCLAWIRL